MNAEEEIEQAIREIVKLLALGRYDAIVQKTSGQRLNAKEIEDAVLEYGRTIVVPPDGAFDSLDIIKVEGKEEYSVRFDLWTRDAGRSDLTLELTFLFNKGSCHIEIDGIHVL